MMIKSLFKGFIKNRNHAIQDVGNVEQNIVQFISDRGPGMWHQPGLP